LETNRLLLQSVRKPKRRAGESFVQPAVYNASISLDGTRRTIETQTFVGNVLFHTHQQLKSVGCPTIGNQGHPSDELQRLENKLWIMQCTNEKILEENEKLKNQNSTERI